MESCILPDAVSDSWSEAAVCHHLQRASSDRLWQCNLHVQGRHWWRELDLWLWPKAKQQSSQWKMKSKVKSMLIIFFLREGDCSQRIRPGRPKNQFCMLLWCFTTTAWKCAKTSPRTLVTKELTVASGQHTPFLFLLGNFLTKITWLSSPIRPTHLTWPPVTSPFPQFKIKLKGRHFDTIEVIKAESQAVLNTLTYQCWEQCIHVDGDYIEGDVG
jgi:hypothetical protein